MPASAETVTLTPSEMRAAAARSVLEGRADQAAGLAEALIARDANDIDAWLVLSRARRDLGQHAQALEAGREAWRLAETRPHRHAAALAQAQALSSQGQRTRAQLWLRRAVEAAPTPQARATAIRDFRYLRARNPWSTTLSFSIAPSDNVNGGSASATSELFGLPLAFALEGSARALPGTEATAGIRGRYRWQNTGAVQVDLLYAAQQSRVWLSDTARDRAPDADARDFDTAELGFGLRLSGTAADGRSAWSVTGEAQRFWYGGTPYVNSVKLTATGRTALGPRTLLAGSLGHEWQAGLGTRPDAGITRARMTLARALPGGARLSWSLGWEESAADADYLTYTRRDTGLRLALGAPVLGMDVSFGVTAAEKRHDQSALTGGARVETTFGGDVTLVFREADFLGFVPALRLETQRTDGTIDLLDGAETGFGLSLQSAF
ncbi:hypothetical protein [Pseudaestuariivita sp.]|uniref:hypothetical protein n=1 Tax=Pseudaestuariivita sp. TaxID=2211669 RepID=UPI004058A66C